MIRHFKQRPSVFISAAFVLPLCLCCYIGNGSAQRIFPFILAFSLFSAACTVMVHRFKITFTAALILLLCAAMPLGVYLVKCSDAKCTAVSKYIGKSITAEGTVYHYQNDERGYTVYLRVHNVDGRKTEKFNLRIRVDGTSAPLLYDTAVFDVVPKSFQKTYYRPYSVYDYYRSEGLHADSSGVFKGTKSSSGFIFRIIRIMENSMSEALDKLTNSALAKALIIGDRTCLDGYTSNIFTKAGIAHVLALSGLHVGIILAFVRKFMGALTCPKYITIPVSVLTVLFYIVMTGGSYSVMRAGIMAIVGFGAFLLLLRHDLLNSIAIAVTLILIYEPYAVKSISFQLSCGAVVGIAVFALPTVRYIRKRFEKYIFSNKYYIRLLCNTAVTVLSSVVVTFSVLLFTFPTTLYYTGDILPVSFLSNIVIIPLTAPVMIILIVYIIMYLIPLFPIRMVAVKLLLPVSDFLLGFFENTAKFFADFNIPMINLSHIAYPLFSVSVAVTFALLILTKSRLCRYFEAFGIVLTVCIVFFVFNFIYKSARVHFLSDGYSSCAVFEQNSQTYVCVGQEDFSYAVKSHCSEYLKTVLNGVIITPQYGECIASLDSLYADGIKVESIYICGGDENEIKIRSLLGHSFPDIKIYNYEINQPFLGGFVVKPDGTVEKEIFSKRFVLYTSRNNDIFSGEYGDITVIYSGKNGKVFEQNQKTHDITYCKTHILNITDSKITMRCYG